MRLCNFLIVFILGCTVSVAYAQSVKLSSEKITKNLVGNTLVGKWKGKDYRHFIKEDGLIFFEKNKQIENSGQWKINEETEEFSSIFPGDENWQSWFVMEYTNEYYWVSKTTPPTKFKIEDGNTIR